MIKVGITAVTLCVALFTAAGVAQEQPYTTLPDLVISSKDSYWQTGTFSTVMSGNADVTVDEKSKKQLWEGFGGTFNEMGWEALSVVSSEIPRALKLLFDPKEGANFNSGRIPMGASDFAMNWYTLNTTTDDFAMEHFSLDRDREKLIPFVKAALTLRPDLYLWGSPWTPPPWMVDGRNMKSDPKILGAYALYFAKFVEEYGKEDITIKAMHVQNEPGYAQTIWGQPLLFNFIKNYLGPKFTERSIDAEIWFGTMSHPDDGTMAITCMRDSTLMKYVKGFGMQWNSIDAVGTLAQKYRVWQTEHRCGNYNFAAPYWDPKLYDPNTAQNDHRYAEESWQNIRDWIAAGVHAYCAWNMVLDTKGKNVLDWHQNALLVVDRSAKKLIITPAYYVFRHFSQYINPGATRIATSGSKDALAFENPDGSIITEVYNKNDALQRITIKVKGTLYQFNLPSHGWATFSVRPPVKAPPRLHPAFKNSTSDLRISRKGGSCQIALHAATEKSGRIDLLTANGSLLMSQRILPGTRSLSLPLPATANGLLLVRVVQDGQTDVVRFYNAP